MLRHLGPIFYSKNYERQLNLVQESRGDMVSQNLVVAEHISEIKVGFYG